MSDREKIIRYFSAIGHGDVAEQLLDAAETVRRGRPFAVSSFYSPIAGQIAMTIKGHFPELTVQENGGYQTAERIKVAFTTADYHGTVDWDLAVVRITWDERYRMIGHRDVLGALVNLGLDRKVFGDIIVKGGSAQVMVDAAMVSFLQRELVRISVVGVSVEEMDLADIEPLEERVKQVKTMVASLRLDAVAAAGFGVSRSKMASEIAAAKVQVNWQQAKGASQPVAVGDVISFRGRGRLVVAEMTDTSRKGRIGLLLERYM